jgi:ribonuclease HI
VAVLDESGIRTEGHAGAIGSATNNVAEYTALLEALALAAARGAQDVEIFADSELVVRQIQGLYRVKNLQLKPLHAEAQRRIAGLRSFRIVHVRRGDNKEADRLVNLALDRGAAGEPVRVVETGPVP